MTETDPESRLKALIRKLRPSARGPLLDLIEAAQSYMADVTKNRQNSRHMSDEKAGISVTVTENPAISVTGRKRGRPPTGQAKTGAERMRAMRARKRERAAYDAIGKIA